MADETSAGGPGHLSDERSPDGALVRFGVFELDLRTAELRRGGVKVKLQEQPFRLLAFLLARPGQVVTREELREQLWPTDFVDFDQSLNTAIRKLRAALDDSADNPRFVETLARRGYRFIAPVSKAGEASASPTSPRLDPAAADPPAPFPAKPGQPRRYRLPIILAAFVIVAAGLATYFGTRNSSASGTGGRTAEPPRVAAIAVLPFFNENPQTAHLSDGISEILIDTLSRVSDLRVMGRTTVFRFKGQPFDPQKIGRELNVAAVVTGTVREEAGQQTIHVELIDATDGSRLWGDQYQTTSSSLPAVQTRISDDLISRLRRGLARPGSAPNRYANNPEAYELYLKGLQALNRRTPEEFQEAVRFFKKSIELDPNSAATYAALSQTYGVMTGYEQIPAAEGAPLVVETAKKALALDPDNSDAYVSLATTKFRNLLDFPGAEKDYQRAIALNPSNATAHQWYADYLRAMGRFEEGRAAQERSRELEPLSRVLNAAYCGAAMVERRYEEAIARARRAEILGRHPAGNKCLIHTLTILGDYEGAVAEMDAAEVPQQVVESLRAALRNGGPEGFIRERLRILRNQRPRPYDATLDIAGYHALLGEKDAAFQTLEDGYARRVSMIISFHYSPLLDGLRDDPRFEKLASRLGLPPEGMAAADALRRQRPFTTLVGARAAADSSSVTFGSRGGGN